MPLAQRDPPHYLRALTTTTTPKRLLWLDCAGTSTKDRGLFVERWQSGALGTTHYTSRKNRRIDTLDSYADAHDLWLAADNFCKPNRRTVLFAYDLARQLRISRALTQLPALGWRLERIVLERTAAWALLRNDKRTLMCCDLKSWTPVELARIATDLDAQEWPGRAILAGTEYAANKCAYHASVVRGAVLQIFNWIEGENLGQFRPTGAGQSYAAYRRRFMRHRFLVHDDTDRLRDERAAMWTGRCEAWKHGNLTNGPFVEYDMHAAYCHIAAECDVPTVAVGTMRKPNAERLRHAMQTHALLADVTITTDVPCVPTRYGGRTVWPTGTFRTLLYDPELKLALHHATKLTCHHAYKYQRGPALRDFARWVLSSMGGQTQVYGRVPERVLKHWSRCLVGRLGLRFRSWEKFGTQDTPDLRLVTFIDTDEGTTTDLLIAGYDRLILADMTEGAESLPQVPGWVMSECRRRLWEAMTTVGLDGVVYVDTDSIVTCGNPASAYMTAFEGLRTPTWTMKGTYSRMTVYGPRNLVCQDARRVAGLPLAARQVAPLEFTGQVMRSIKESMRAGELDCVASLPRRFMLDAPDLRRQHLPGSDTAPYHIQPSTTTEET